jgi:ABC-type oligopeptide transport system, periplasmic component
MGHAQPTKHAIAMHGDIKYPPDFKHFNGINPNSPKGGTLKLGAVGTFDSTNPFLVKGTPPVGLSLFSETFVFEGLMMRSPDEPFTLYPWLAESVETPPDHSAITFHLNPKATWADGRPVTADDVIFSHATLKEKGRPHMHLYYSQVAEVKKIDTHTVQFTFKKTDEGIFNPEMPMLIALMRIIPRHFFAGRDFEKVSLEPMLGSGPYKISQIKPGHRIVYERRPDYWGADLPGNVGLYNFDRIEIEYYREPNVARVAFAAGEYDYRAEFNPAEWLKSYDFKAVKEGKVKKITLTHKHPVGIHAYAMNTRRALFKDPKVRQALAYAFDFHWINKNLYHGTFKRIRSFFENTELAHQGAPTTAELALLAPFKEGLPKEVFEQPYYPANYPATVSIRDSLQRARDLLAGAGWHIEKGKLIHHQTKQPFVFELLLYNKEDEKVALEFARTLRKLGIDMRIRTLDPAQFEMRRLKFDFDMILHTWGMSLSPGNQQKFFFHSSFADQEGSRNYPGIKHPAVDFLTEKIATAQSRAELKTAVHALDRVLLWGHYVIPLGYKNTNFLAHWDRIAHPELSPEIPIRLTSWWCNDLKNK